MSLADYSTAIELDPSDLNHYYNRAWVHLFLSQGSEAHQDAVHYLDFNGKDKSDPVIIAYLGLRKSGKILPAKSFLTNWLRQSNQNEWKTQILKYFSGQLTSAALLGLSNDNEKWTEAHTYIGEMELLINNKTAAIEHFRLVRDSGSKTLFSYNLAIAELKRLE